MTNIVPTDLESKVIECHLVWGIGLFNNIFILLSREFDRHDSDSDGFIGGYARDGRLMVFDEVYLDSLASNNEFLEIEKQILFCCNFILLRGK